MANIRLRHIALYPKRTALSSAPFSSLYFCHLIQVILSAVSFPPCMSAQALKANTTKRVARSAAGTIKSSRLTSSSAATAASTLHVTAAQPTQCLAPSPPTLRPRISPLAVRYLRNNSSCPPQQRGTVTDFYQCIAEPKAQLAEARRHQDSQRPFQPHLRLGICESSYVTWWRHPYSLDWGNSGPRSGYTHGYGSRGTTPVRRNRHGWTPDSTLRNASEDNTCFGKCVPNLRTCRISALFTVYITAGGGEDVLGHGSIPRPSRA
ncbi:hypothetical protein K437DRAFT_119234 [Tilletiaria anomala UBC 951]|uniref:Uncharacterized protein n=1 Tax=Tilletiaria anomala (strain ATCC 24038 / CBS 436.72 / UBC 951) TaxID=1037660 RepID=A0A066W3U8_TILAU|nr:uncharacterized protein K437DRAFT_119234 [Tilletiaria anomala UBC 951]KDN45759.1 hypothetical protein K437DRAFT_119234 [Tilletiaria anomala UBC 951]